MKTYSDSSAHAISSASNQSEVNPSSQLARNLTAAKAKQLGNPRPPEIVQFSVTTEASTVFAAAFNHWFVDAKGAVIASALEIDADLFIVCLYPEGLEAPVRVANPRPIPGRLPWVFGKAAALEAATDSALSLLRKAVAS